MRWSDLQGQFADHHPPTFPTAGDLTPVATEIWDWIENPDFPTRAPRCVPPPHGCAPFPSRCHVRGGTTSLTSPDGRTHLD